MHLLIILTTLIAFANAQVCRTDWIYKICTNVTVKTFEPITNASGITFLQIQESFGSIGKNTFAGFDDVEELTLIRNEIDFIEAGALCSMPRLTRLRLGYYGKLPVLTRQHFEGCEQVTKLALHSVTLDSNALEGFSNVRELYLAELHLPTLTGSFFEPFRNLEKLILHENYIAFIESGALCRTSQLRSLHITDNLSFPTLTKEILNNCQSVEDFVVTSRYQQDASFEEDALSGLSSLATVTFEGVRIRNVTKKMFTGPSMISKIVMKDNGIQNITDDAFENLRNLKELTIAHTSLKNISENWFGVPDDMAYLHFYNNKLSSIEHLKGLNLIGLDLRKNNVTEFDVAEFEKKFRNLKYLHLEGNPMSRNFVRDVTITLSDHMGTQVYSDVWSYQ